jgi:hypothetical protein
MTFFQLDAEKLQPGDVVLEAGSGAISKLIKVADRPRSGSRRGSFSHVFVYVGYSNIMEADEGVRLLAVNRIITAEPDRFLVLRHPDYPKGLDRPEWQEYANSLMFRALYSEANKPYDWWGALATKLPFLKGRANSFFCSQLVAEGYRRLGIPIFKHSVAPADVTPNMFLSDECLLKPVPNCFHALPDRPWIAEFARKRYDVMKTEPVPLAQRTHECAVKMVKTFGPRVDALTRSINKKQHIASPEDLYLTLTFPDLPDGDRVSDELVEFMEINYPAKEIAEYMQLSKSSLEAGISLNDPEVTAMIVKTLRKDIAASEKLQPQLEASAQMMRSFPPSFLKRRSIHDWLAKTSAQSVATQLDFLQWQKALLARLTEGT